MPEIAGQSAWVWIAIAAAVLLVLGVGGFFAYRFLSTRVVRRHVIRMVGLRADLEASRRALDTVVEHLSDADDETLLLFAQDAYSVDRRTFHEVAQRMRMMRDELDHTRLPVRVIPLAEQIADSAHVIAVEAGRVRDNMAPDEVLDALGSVDLGTVSAHLEETQALLDAACREYDIEEAAVYGGGLYL